MSFVPFMVQNFSYDYPYHETIEQLITFVIHSEKYLKNDIRTI